MVPSFIATLVYNGTYMYDISAYGGNGIAIYLYKSWIKRERNYVIHNNTVTHKFFVNDIYITLKRAIHSSLSLWRPIENVYVWAVFLCALCELCYKHKFMYFARDILIYYERSTYVKIWFEGNNDLPGTLFHKILVFHFRTKFRFYEENFVLKNGEKYGF